MQFKNPSSHSVNAMVIFWLGVLTGAIVVGLVFLYKSVSSSDIDAALLKYNVRPAVTTTATSTSKAVPPPYKPGF